MKDHYFKGKMPPNLMKDYDCIGFDVDHCMVKYNVVDYIRHTFKVSLSILFNNFGYPKEILVQDWA
jgi:hypothetical protein